MKSPLTNFWKSLLSPHGAAVYASVFVLGTLVLREPMETLKSPALEEKSENAVVFLEPIPARMSELNGSEVQTALTSDQIESARKMARQQNRRSRAKKVAGATSSYPYKVMVLNSNWKSRRNLANLSAQTRRALERNRYIDSELASDFATDATAIDGWNPDLALLEAALEEEVQTPTDYSKRESSPAQLDVELALGMTFADEAPYRDVVGEYVRETFSGLRESFAQLKDPEILTPKKVVKKPEPRLVKASSKKKSRRPQQETELASQGHPSHKPLRGKVASSSNWTARAPQVPEKPFLREVPIVRSEPTLSEPTLVTSETGTSPQSHFVESGVSSLQEPVLSTESELGPSPAPVAAAPAPVDPPAMSFAMPSPAPAPPPRTVAQLASPVTASLAPPLPSDPRQALPQRRVVTPADVDTQKQEGVVATAATISEAVRKAFDDTPFESEFSGGVKFGPGVRDWLDGNNGHVEFYLRPVGSRDPQGTEYVSYRPAPADLHHPAKGLVGRYLLVAGFHRPQDIDEPFGEATYPEEINAATARQPVFFKIDSMSDVKVTSHSSNGEGHLATVHLSFFEGAAADYREPKEIPLVKVRVIGYEKEYGELTADEQGNLSIHAFPTHSDIPLSVSAEGYFPTTRSFRVFGGDAHVPIYLVSRDKVNTMVAALVGVRQVAAAALLMGRVFDPQTRNPLKGERLELVDQPANRGSFFSVFGTPGETIETGFYSFFNMGAAFRLLERPHADKRTYRISTQPGHGYYVELGRGGMKSFFGSLTDPNLPSENLPEGYGNVEGARITLVGDEKFETYTDSKGQFEIPGIDFPNGLISLDIESPRHFPEYWMTRHTIPFNPRRASSREKLYLVQDRFVSESLTSAYATPFGPNPVILDRNPDTGNLVGGAFEALLKQSPNCLRVELWSVDSAKLVAPEHGPFPFRGPAAQGPLCLKPKTSGFTFQYLPSGEYLMKWINESGRAIGGRIIHIGKGRDSIAVN